MSVEFDEGYQDGQNGRNQNGALSSGSFQRQGFDVGDQQPKMVAWLIRHHIAKSEKTANAFLLCLSFCFLLLSAFIMFKFVL